MVVPLDYIARETMVLALACDVASCHANLYIKKGVSFPLGKKARSMTQPRASVTKLCWNKGVDGPFRPGWKGGVFNTPGSFSDPIHM